MKKYCNMQGYSDTTPYEVIKVISDKTLEIRSMTVEKDPSYKAEFVPGGFSAHCTNNRDQKWLIKSNPEGHVFRVRKRKTRMNYGEDIYWHQTARYRLSDKPHYFYDYNF